MPDASTLAEARNLLAHPWSGWAAAAVVSALALFIVYKINIHAAKTLEGIQTNIAVQTAHTAASVEGMRSAVTALERIGGALHDHNRDEEQRHKANGDRIDLLHRANIDRLDRIERAVRHRPPRVEDDDEE